MGTLFDIQQDLAAHFLRRPLDKTNLEEIANTLAAYDYNKSESLRHGLITPAIGQATLKTLGKINSIDIKNLNTSNVELTELKWNFERKKIQEKVLTNHVPSDIQISHYVAKIKNADIYLGTHGFSVFTSGKEYIEGLCRGDGLLYGISGLHVQTESIKLSGTTLFLYHLFCNGYFHWILEVIPRLIMIEKAGYSIKDFDKIIVRAKDNTVLETFDHFGVGREKIIAIPPNTRIFSECSIFTDSLENYDYDVIPLGIPIEPWIPLEVGTRFEIGFNKITNGSKIFIDRRNEKIRRIENQSDIDRVLTRHNINPVDFRKYTIHQKIGLLRTANLIVGPSGAGFANLVFAPNSIETIIFYQKGFETNSFKTIADTKKINHVSVLSEIAANEEGKVISIHNDIAVDTKTLEDILSR